jgi:hypothetical protein
MAPGGGMGAAMGAFGAAAAGGARPTKRNPIVTYLISIAGFIALQILVNVLVFVLPLSMLGILSLVVNLLNIGAYVWFCLVISGMMKEAGAVVNEQLPAWLPFVPIYNSIKAHELVTRAKPMAGSQVPARNIVLYVLFPSYFLAADLNDIAQ